MTHQTEAELLPCPFCGSRARRAKEGAWHGTGCAGAHGCPAYLSALTYRTQEEADEAWNRRAPAAPVPQFSRIAQKKLDYLLEAGESITGYAIENKDGRRGAIDCHGFVYWWQDAAVPVPQGWKLVPVELLDRATESLGSFVSDHGWGRADMDTFDDLSALAAAPLPPGAAPVQLPENIREGEPYDNPAFEALARALGVWGTAQSAVCAQFWIAAKEQST